MLDETTLVLGAGGPWGVAWMTGLLLGLEESGLAVRHARAMIGSSAGAILGARIGAGIAIQTLFDQETSIEEQSRQAGRFRDLAPPRPDTATPTPASNLSSFHSIHNRTWDVEDERIRAICDLAASARTVSWAELRRRSET
jgi:predicted acylesterase/phospholipase RssA